MTNTAELTYDQIGLIVREDLEKTLSDLKNDLNWRMEGTRPPVFCLDANEDCKEMKKVIKAIKTVIDSCYYIEEKDSAKYGC